jgi:hypothetical protein
VTPGDAEFNQPVELTRGALFDDETVRVEITNDFVVEGTLIIHGSLTVEGSSSFGGPQVQFAQPYYLGNGQRLANNPQGNLYRKFNPLTWFEHSPLSRKC